MRAEPGTRSRGAASPAVSVVVPVHDEADNLAPLVDEIQREMTALGAPWELLIIDDGSTDGTDEVISWLEGEHPELVPVRLPSRRGKSAALSAGIASAQAEIVVTLDGDLQNDPADIPALVARLAEGFDLVNGRRRHRQDPPLKRLQSLLFNAVVRRVFGVPLHDLNCGLKAFRRSCVPSASLHDGMHRYLPVLVAARLGRVTELPVRHRPRLHGRSKYGLERVLPAALDLCSVLLMIRLRVPPPRAHALSRSLGALLGVGGCALVVSWVASLTA